MREIKFRGIRVDTNKWVYGYYYDLKGTTYIIEEGTGFFDIDCGEAIFGTAYCHEVIPETVGQYTGLKNKNGKEIYEEDIVKVDDIISVIRYEEKHARFVIDDYGIKGCLMEYGFDEDAGEYGIVDTNGFDDFYDITDSIEINGNVYENSELLKQ